MKIKKDFVLNGIFCKTTSACVFTYLISSFYHNFNEFYAGGGWVVWVEVAVGGESSPPQNEFLKSASISGLIFK